MCVTGDGLLIAGSEAGMVPVDEAQVVEKGALGPGQMIGVDMDKGALFHDAEIKDKHGRRHFRSATGSGKINELDRMLSGALRRRCSAARELRKRQIAAGYSH